MTTMNPGQSVVLTCQPMLNGVLGGVLPAPGVITWTNNANLVPMNGVTITPDPMNSCIATLMVPANVNGGSFTVWATCGVLTASEVITVNPPVANGLQIVAGVPA